MNTRSKGLYCYLQETGAVKGTPEEIALAKKQYRALYKKLWKKQREVQKELRINFTIEQYHHIAVTASTCNLKPTAYVRNIILATIRTKAFIVEKDKLLYVLQLLSMAINTVQKDINHLLKIMELLEQAEQILLTYLDTYNDEKRTPAKF